MKSNLAEVLTEDAPLQHKLATLESEAKDLQVTDDVTRQSADIVIGKLKQAEKEIEQEKEQKTRPLLTELESTRTPFIKALSFVQAIRKELEQRLGTYLANKRKEEQVLQQKAIEDANRKQAELDAKAEADRKAAEALRAAGQTKEADKLDARAEKIEQKAATVVPTIIQATARTTDLGDSKATTQEKPDWILTGRDKTEKLYADDQVFAGLDWENYRRWFVLDPTKVNKAVQAGEKLPPPFQKTTKYGSVHRKA